ncbi:MAG: Uncharacterized protein Greene101447_495 [Parcubacteria group bacterium Greene1014_47]|nr:MAG: Uncharacterized protein Greene101447_495 [Parcubacteria group bacterium Greene1014_47]
MKQYSTRKWSHPEGYKYLAPWTNAVLLRFLMRKFTETLPRAEFRMKTQVNDACRSVVANIEEGWKRPDRKAYLEYLGFSQGSLEEVKGDVRRLHQDGFLTSRLGSSLKDIKVDLKELKGLLEEDKGNTLLEILYPPLKILYSPLSVFPSNPSSNQPLHSFKGLLKDDKGNTSNSSLNSSSNDSSMAFFIKENLTFEMFLELINKTDWLLRGLVQSLEAGMAKEDVLSPFNRWLGKEMETKRQKDKELDGQLQEIIEGKRQQLD